MFSYIMSGSRQTGWIEKQSNVSAIEQDGWTTETWMWSAIKYLYQGVIKYVRDI